MRRGAATGKLAPGRARLHADRGATRNPAHAGPCYCRLCQAGPLADNGRQDPDLGGQDH